MINAITGSSPSFSRAMPPVSSGSATTKVSLPAYAVQNGSMPKKMVSSKSATGDKVEISLSAEIKLLKSQGLNISGIAMRLGLDVARVKMYLGLA